MPKYIFIYILLLWGNIAYSKCESQVKFSYQGNGLVQVAALGSFYRNNDKVLFKPIICMNMDKCEDVDLSNFPEPDHKCSEVPVWRDFFDTSLPEQIGVLWVIYSRNANFHEAISWQESFMKRHKYKSFFAEKKIYDRKFRSDSFCHTDSSSILMYRDGLIEDTWSFKTETNFKLSFAKFAEEKIKGCGCEEYFGDDRKVRPPRNSSIELKFERVGKKIFYLEKKYDSRFKPYYLDRVEIVQGDKCNIFLNELFGKDVSIDLYENLEIKNGKIKYINTCINPIVSVSK
jgi:hypothetical protein